MRRKFGVAFLVLCTSAIISSTSYASTQSFQFQLTKTAIDYNVVSPRSDGNFHNGILLAEQSDGDLVYYNVEGDRPFTLSADIMPVSDFYEQRAIVKNTTTNLYGYVNTKGELAIPCNYIYAGKFTEGVAHVTISDSNDEVLIDRTGKITTKLLEKYISDFAFSEGLSVAYAPTGNKIGFINTLGELTIPYEYVYARDFSEGLALVQSSKGSYGYIGTSGEKVIPFYYQSGGDYSEGLAPVKNTKGKWGYIDKKGKLVIPFKYDNASVFSEGLAIVYNANGKVGYINKQGKQIIGYGEYTRGNNFKEGIALVGITTKNDPEGKFGYIDRQGNLLTKLEYRVESSSFNLGFAVAVKSSGNGVILGKQTITK